MNDDEDMQAFIQSTVSLIEQYTDKIDNNNFIGILLGICKMIGAVEGIKAKDFRKRLKDIIDTQIYLEEWK